MNAYAAAIAVMAELVREVIHNQSVQQNQKLFIKGSGLGCNAEHIGMNNDKAKAMA